MIADELHVIPQGDLTGHDTLGDCACIPRVRPVKRGDGSMGWLTVHSSLDGRELREPDRAAR